MPKIEDLSVDNHIWGVMIYGPHGVGKTHFLGTVPKPLFIFDFDRGIMSLKGGSDVSYIQPNAENWKQYQAFYENFLIHKRTAKFEGEEFNLDDYASIAFDSMTTVLAITMAKIAEKIDMKDRVIMDGIRGTHRADYNFAQVVLGDFVRDLQQTKKNFFLTSHERVEKDEKSGTVLRVGPSISPSAFNALATPIDEIWRLDCVAAPGGKRKRIMITAQEGIWTGKARVLSPTAGRVENPTFDKLKALVK